MAKRKTLRQRRAEEEEEEEETGKGKEEGREEGTPFVLKDQRFQGKCPVLFLFLRFPGLNWMQSCQQSSSGPFQHASLSIRPPRGENLSPFRVRKISKRIPPLAQR